VRAVIADTLARLRSGAAFTGARLAWIQPAGFHITLVFLGDTPPAHVPAVADALRRVAASHAPFKLAISGVGIFPSPRNPRAISMNIVKDVEALQQVYRDLAPAMRRLGFSIEDRVYTPHLTLARIKDRAGLAALRDLVRSHRLIRSDSFEVSSVILYRSQLKPTGAEYEILADAPFKRQ
jgi:2'-5' RNA ligase